MKFLGLLACFFIYNTYANPIISQLHHERIGNYLDNICMDTFCGGDINWIEPSLSCDNKKCILKNSAMSWYEDEWTITPESFAKLPKESKLSGNAQLIAVEITESDVYSDPFIGPKIITFCELNLPVGISKLSYSDQEDAVYEATLDCLRAMSGIAFFIPLQHTTGHIVNMLELIIKRNAS